MRKLHSSKIGLKNSAFSYFYVVVGNTYQEEVLAEYVDAYRDKLADAIWCEDLPIKDLLSGRV